MGRFIVSYDNVAPSGTWTASALQAGYQAAWAADKRADRGARLSGVSPWLLCNFGVATRVDIIAVIGYTGSSILIEAGNSAPGGASPLRFNLTPGAVTVDGFWPSPWGKVTGRTGYTTSGYSQWKFTFGGSNTHVSEIFMGQFFQTMDIGPQWGAERRYKRNTITHVTEMGVPLSYDRGETTREFKARFITVGAEMTDVMMDWWRTGRAVVEPQLVIPDDGEPNDAWLTIFNENTIAWRSIRGYAREWDVSFRELPRGVVL